MWRRATQRVLSQRMLVEMATMGSARALGMADEVGSLEVGKKVDLVIVDTLKAHLVPTTRIVSAFVHNGRPSDVESVMVDGEFVMRDGKMANVDEQALIEETDQIRRRVWARIIADYPDYSLPFSVEPG